MMEHEYYKNPLLFNPPTNWRAANTNRWPWRKRLKAYGIWALIALTLVSFLLTSL
jgi:hypothetical protein